MKVNGRKPQGPNEVVVVIPRSGEEDFVFKARAITDFSEFERICPPPIAPKSSRPGGQWFENRNDPQYKAKVSERDTRLNDWMALQSISATEGLEWESVDMADPSTWSLWSTELQKAGFSRFEINRITTAVSQANCLDDEMMEAAKASFFAKQKAAAEEVATGSQTVAQPVTSFGAPVSA